jgi:putative aminopeptidase FrvX
VSEGYFFPECRHNLLEVVTAIPPPHGPEDAVRARLDQDVDEFENGFMVEGFDNIIEDREQGYRGHHADPHIKVPGKVRSRVELVCT